MVLNIIPFYLFRMLVYSSCLIFWFRIKNCYSWLLGIDFEFNLIFERGIIKRQSNIMNWDSKHIDFFLIFCKYLHQFTPRYTLSEISELRDNHFWGYVPCRRRGFKRLQTLYRSWHLYVVLHADMTLIGSLNRVTHGNRVNPTKQPA